MKEDSKQHGYDEEHANVPDDADISQLHVPERYAGQSRKRENPRDDHRPPDPGSRAASAENRRGEQYRQREEDIPSEDVESVHNRRPVEAEEQGEPRLLGECGLVAYG